jgi:hypothetical protein
MIKGEKDEAERIVCGIERRVAEQTGERPDDVDETIELHPRESTGFLTIGRVLFKEYTGRMA